MHAIDFRLIRYDPGWGGSGMKPPPRVIDVIIDDTRLLDLVRQAELPYALEEQRAREAEFAPEPAPLLAGNYMCLPSSYGWPSRHFLGEPEERPWFVRDDKETVLLTCTCGDEGCWALTARVEVGETVVRWSGFRNNHRDWDLSALGGFTFSRPLYEQALRRTARSA